MQQKTMGSHSQRGFRLSSLAPALFGALSLGLALGVQAQTVPTPNATNPASLPDAPTPQPPPRDDVTVRNVPRNFLEDQAIIWTSPARIRTHDLKWIIPLGVATGVALATDHYVLTNVVSTNPSFNSANINASNAMIYSLVAAPVALYGFGRIEGDDHARETGILTAESMVDGVVVEQGLKLALWQERPYQDTARGRFFQSIAGIDSSFPSSHTLIAFSAASAIAAEYPSRPVQWLVYTGATGVGLTRVLGRDHFPADVLVGGALGWLIGHSVVKHRHHHDLKAEITGHDGH
ncbi:MAG TPA: phosphatase PAP2 family protein [Terracidiphilus sp.]